MDDMKKMLEENYPFLSRTMKTRFAKLEKKVTSYLKELSINASPTEEDNTEDLEDDSDNLINNNVTYY